MFGLKKRFSLRKTMFFSTLHWKVPEIGPYRGRRITRPAGLRPKIGQNVRCVRNPKVIFRAGAKNYSKFQFSGLLGPFSRLEPEIVQNDPVQASWGHFPGWVRKCLKIIVFEPPEPISQAGANNDTKRTFSGLLGNFLGCALKMLQMSVFERPGAIFRSCPWPP